MFKLFRKASTPGPQAEPVPSAPALPAKGRVMLVDDDPVVRKALGMKLAAAGYELIYAADGAEAVNKTRSENPEVIILDINFPPEPGSDWDGFKVMRWLQRSPESFRVPIVIITGDDSPQCRAKAKDSGAVGYFPKPVDTLALIAAIDQLFAGSKARAK